MASITIIASGDGHQMVKWCVCVAHRLLKRRASSVLQRVPVIVWHICSLPLDVQILELFTLSGRSLSLWVWNVSLCQDVQSLARSVSRSLEILCTVCVCAVCVCV
eukprot:scpid65886/ scgid7054/ 